MSYPKTIPAFRSALVEFDGEGLSDEVAEQVFAAQAVRSPVVSAVKTFKALKDAADLDQREQALLCGAAYLIAENGWHELAGEAFNVVMAQGAALEQATPADTGDVL